MSLKALRSRGSKLNEPLKQPPQLPVSRPSKASARSSPAATARRWTPESSPEGWVHAPMPRRTEPLLYKVYTTKAQIE